MSKKAVILLLALSLLALPGCSGTSIYTNYHEVEDLELIRTVGVDKAANQVEVTICSGVGLSGSAPKMYTNRARTLSTALSVIQKEPVGKEMYYAHTEHLVIGEEAARNGMEEYLDYVERSPEIRLDTNMFLVKGASAQEVITQVATEKTAAADILHFLANDVNKLGLGKVYSCGDVASALAKNGNALVMAIELEESKELSENSAEKMIAPAGYAVLKDGYLQRFLSMQESYGVSILENSTDYDDLEVPCDDEGNYVTLGVEKIDTSISANFENGEILSVDILVEVETSVTEADCMIDIMDAKVRKTIAEQVSAIQSDRVKSALRAAQDMNIDFLNLGNKIEIKSPVKFKKMQNKWEDIFSALPIRVEVKTTLERTYNTGQPIEVVGSEA